MKDFIDYYELLGVDPSATNEQIDKAYRVRMREAHPDRHDGAVNARLLTERLIEARKTLKDSAARAKHDVKRAHHRAAQSAHAQLQRIRARQVPRPSFVTPSSPPPSHLTGTPTVPSQSSSGWGPVVGLGLSALGIILALGANDYDPHVGRYRNGRGRFRRGRFF